MEQVTSVKLLNDIGFKTKVCLDDALEILEAWVNCGDSFKSRYKTPPFISSRLIF